MASYDVNTDYQAKINDAVAKGDYQSAAKYEQQRNAKIDGTGSTYEKTNNYSQYLSSESGGSSGSGGGRTVSSGSSGSGGSSGGTGIRGTVGAGSAGVSTTEAEIRAQMAANSAAWHTADTAEQERLHAENERLAAQLGGLTYDEASGTWSSGGGRTVPDGFTGSTVIQNTPNQSAQDIIDKMNANSVAWHTADDATRAQLHAENEYLASVLQGLGVTDVTYDEASGRWTGAALTEDSLLPAYDPAQLPSAISQGDSINSYYDAAQKAQLAALEAAYNQNIIETDAAAAKIPGIYQAGMNQAASQDAIARQTFNETAAAGGLNTGARGQAALARNVALQGKLSQLEAEKASALADVETQRLKIKTAYQDEIAQAIANNELARAEALYQEAVRVDESVVQTAINQAEENYRAWSTQYQTGTDYINRQLNTEDRDYQRLLSNAQSLAQFGDFSGYRALGFTDEQIDRMYTVWAAENPYIASALGYRGSTGGTASGGGSASGYGYSSMGASGGNSGSGYSSSGNTSGQASAGAAAAVAGSSGYQNTLRRAQNMYNGGASVGAISAMLQQQAGIGAITSGQAGMILDSLGIR